MVVHGKCFTFKPFWIGTLICDMRRNIILVAILLLCIESSFAQKGFYINPTFRNGIGLSEQEGLLSTNPSTNIVYAHGAEIGFGYSINRLRIQSGIGYNRSAFSYNAPTVFFPNSSAEDVRNIMFNSLTGGLQIGYVLRNNKLLAVVPYIGATYGLNYSAKNVTELPDGTIIKKKMGKDIFQDRYEQQSIWATFKLHFEYRFAQDAALVFGPAMQYMVTDLYSINIDGDIPTLQTHNIFMDIGLIWIFPKASNSAKNRMPSLYN